MRQAGYRAGKGGYSMLSSRRDRKMGGGGGGASLGEDVTFRSSVCERTEKLGASRSGASVGEQRRDFANDRSKSQSQNPRFQRSAGCVQVWGSSCTKITIGARAVENNEEEA